MYVENSRLRILYVLTSDRMRPLQNGGMLLITAIKAAGGRVDVGPDISGLSGGSPFSACPQQGQHFAIILVQRQSPPRSQCMRTGENCA